LKANANYPRKIAKSQSTLFFLFSLISGFQYHILHDGTTYSIF